MCYYFVLFLQPIRWQAVGIDFTARDHVDIHLGSVHVSYVGLVLQSVVRLNLGNAVATGCCSLMVTIATLYAQQNDPQFWSPLPHFIHNKILTDPQ